MTQTISTAATSAGRAAASSASRIATQLAASHAATAVSNLLFGPSRRVTAGVSVDEIRVLTASEGGGVPRVYGRARVGGQVIWASPVREETFTVASTRGAKGVRAATESRSTEYRYFASVAIALCEGPIARIGRVWADGKPVSLADITHRVYTGSDEQQPDPLIESAEGSAPGYAGLAYIVFEDLPLAPFGNRIPQFNFEVQRPLRADDPATMENAIRAVTVIPGSGEAVYDPAVVFETPAEGVSRALNRHGATGVPDFEASLDQLEGTLPNVSAVSLVISWFGDDLRAGICRLRPGVETRDRTTEPQPWSVAGYDRQSARLLGQEGGQPAYGGTPPDASVVAAIEDLKARGHAVVIHPFILMDIQQGNGKPDPHGGSEQAPFPWRGRITADLPGDDGTAAARLQVDSFFDELDAMVLHYAGLAAQAGGVEAFLLGSELRGLTRLRDETGAFPAAARLRALAAQVRALLPGAKISYGADWTEYGAYVPGDGTGDLLYPLDPFWSDVNVDFVGIDNYLPLTDWRDGDGHLDEAVAAGPYDPDYLAAGIGGGEGHGWFYASEADRLAQIRTPITDGAYGEDWVFRVKDLWSWWLNPHTERIGGVKASATPWQPQSKPLWFTELGCPAIDKGPNQPNVFIDPKSSESAPPYHSTGWRDDRAQRSFLEAHHAFWSDPANNPVSSVYGAPMVRADRIFVYAWDARPFPDFPARAGLWADAGNWVTGHWLNGRAGRVPLGTLIEELASEAGLSAVDASACDALVSGLVLPGPMTAREALEPLFDLYQLDAVMRGGTLRVFPRHGRPVRSVAEAELVDAGPRPKLTLERAQDDEIPAALSVSYIDELSGYTSRAIEVRDDSAPGGRTFRIGAAVTLEQGEAEGLARAILAESRAMRLRARFALPEMADGLEPSDVVTVAAGSSAKTLRITALAEGRFRDIHAVSTGPGVFVANYAGLDADPGPMPPSYGPVLFEALDIPLIPAGETSAHLWLAAFAEPWPGAVAVYRGAPAAEDRYATISAQSLMGRLAAPLGAGPCGRWDRASVVVVELPAGAFESVPAGRVLAGDNLCAVETSEGWELLQFRDAELREDGRWYLSSLLRGRFGTEAASQAGAGQGSRIVLLANATAAPLDPDRWGGTERFDVGPDGALPGVFPFRATQVRLAGLGARPLAPVHLKARLDDGGRMVTWVRRTRIGGDRFDAGEVPLGETAEIYDVTIEDAGGAVLGRHTVSEPRFLVDDPDAVAVTVTQRSSSFGAGASARLVLPT